MPKEIEVTSTTYIFAAIGAVILGGIASALLGGVANSVSAGIVGALAGASLSIFF
jgi:outer membrane lipoprotein SlyB